VDLNTKLAILADAAKYDASCASSGSERRDSRNSRTPGGIGSTEGTGIGALMDMRLWIDIADRSDFTHEDD